MTEDGKGDAAELVALIRQFIPDGFRDDDGVWHEGPHRAFALAEVERLTRDNERLEEESATYMNDSDTWQELARERAAQLAGAQAAANVHKDAAAMHRAERDPLGEGER